MMDIAERAEEWLRQQAPGYLNQSCEPDQVLIRLLLAEVYRLRSVHADTQARMLELLVERRRLDATHLR